MTTEPPRPLTIGPGPPALPVTGRPVAVSPGREVAFRLVLTGDPNGMHMALVRALRRAGRRGIGPGRNALRLELLDAGPEEAPQSPAEAPGATELELLTPLRLKDGGRIVSELAAGSLVRALVRRGELLAASTGERWSAPFDPDEVAAGLRVEADLRVVPIRRHSARQRRRMSWPGLMGKLRLGGPGLAPLWPLLRLGEVAQIGKGVTFGFGLYRLKPRARRAAPAPPDSR